MLQELKAGQEPQRSHLLAAELRGAGSPCEAAGPAAPRFGLVLKARNLPAEPSHNPFTTQQRQRQARRSLAPAGC